MANWCAGVLDLPGRPSSSASFDQQQRDQNRRHYSKPDNACQHKPGSETRAKTTVRSASSANVPRRKDGLPIAELAQGVPYFRDKKAAWIFWLIATLIAERNCGEVLSRTNRFASATFSPSARARESAGFKATRARMKSSATAAAKGGEQNACDDERSASSGDPGARTDERILNTDSEALDIGAHEVGYARMAQARDIIPARGRQAGGETKPLLLNEPQLNDPKLSDIPRRDECRAPRATSTPNTTSRRAEPPELRLDA